MVDLDLGDDYDEYVEALPDSKLVTVSMVLPGDQLREVKQFCDENGYSLGQGLRILLMRANE
ncbi:MAG: hypothetical protein ABEJ98_02090 [Candidatus Nanohaloarchaea archaeon]